VREVRPDALVLDGGRSLSFDLCIWAGGMRSPPLLREAGLAVDAENRLLVGPDLTSISHPDVLAVGDCAHPLAPTGAPFRRSALAAAVSGVYAAEQVVAARKGERLPPFAFSTFAQAIAVGTYAAVFPLDPDDHQVLFVLGGRGARRLRRLLIWLVLGFLKFERAFPGLQSWPGRRRVSEAAARRGLEAALARRRAPVSRPRTSKVI
jgi:NADH dehydrogenase FAD-containing subunit